MTNQAVLLLNSITDADDKAHGRIAVCGSHGGVYPAYLASKAGLRAVIFNDAGGGLEHAGIAGIAALAEIGVAAAAVSHNSCRIAKADDMVARGRISAVNSIAHKLEVRPGQDIVTASEKLQEAGEASKPLPIINEARKTVRVEDIALEIVLTDSASLVSNDDDGMIIITGSHGGLIGGDPKRALKARPALAVFNDAGIGCDGAGLTRLPALDDQNVPAVTIAHTSARIGDATSGLETGLISATNEKARALGFHIGDRLKTVLATVFSVE